MEGGVRLGLACRLARPKQRAGATEGHTCSVLTQPKLSLNPWVSLDWFRRGENRSGGQMEHALIKWWVL